MVTKCGTLSPDSMRTRRTARVDCGHPASQVDLLSHIASRTENPPSARRAVPRSLTAGRRRLAVRHVSAVAVSARRGTEATRERYEQRARARARPTATWARASARRSRRRGSPAPGRLSLHSLRHTFASLLIAKKTDVAFVSRQPGHASPATTLGVYAHLFDQVQHAATARAALEASYQAMTSTQPREPRGPGSRPVVALVVAGESGQGVR